MVLEHRVLWDPEFVRRSPSFWPLAKAAQALCGSSDWPSRSALDAMYLRCAGNAGDGLAPLRFCENVRKPRRRKREGIALDRLYDGRITLHAEVPTRERHWHDLFNALCFATFPRAKRALHRRQYEALRACVGEQATALPERRSRERDALTLFDEGGAVVAAEPSACAELRKADPEGQGDLLARCVHARRARVVPFGHALFEHLIEGLRCPASATRLITLHQLAHHDDALLTQVDLELARALSDPGQFRGPAEGAVIRFAALGLG